MSETIRVHESVVTEIGLPGDRVCGVCKQTSSKYLCPRCGLRYCSSTCFKHDAHSNCSESFYKQEFMAELQRTNATADERKRMMQILKNFEAQQLKTDAGAIDSDDDPDSEGDESRVAEESLARMQLTGNEDVKVLWAALTKEEREDFLQSLKSGAILEDDAQWTPWWAQSPTPHTAKITAISELHTDVDSRSDSPSDLVDSLAAISVTSDAPVVDERSIAPLSTLIGTKPPSNDLVFNLLDILMAYCFSTRLFNGDQSDSVVDQLCDVFLQVSPVLGANTSHTSVAVSVQSFWSVIHLKPQLAQSSGLAFIAITDVAAILKTSDFALSALFASSTLLERAHTLAKKNTTNAPGSKQARTQLLNAKRKLAFFMSWWVWYRVQPTAECLPIIIRLIEAESQRLASESTAIADNTSTQTGQQVRKTQTSTQPLIQVLQ